VRDVNENLGNQLTSASQMSLELKKQLLEGDNCDPAAVQDRDRRAAVRGPSPRPPAYRRPRPFAAAAQAFSRPQKVRWPRRMKSFRDIRVLPVVLIATFGLAVLKIAGIVIDGGYVFDYKPDSTKPSWRREALNFPGGSRFDTADITGSVKEKPKEEEAAAKPVAAPEAAKTDVVVHPEQGQPGLAVRARDPRAAAVTAAGT